MVRKLKLWWAWQDREHEEWLAQQSRQGLHLRSVALFGLLHSFEQGAPAEVAYRWDFQPTGGKRDYRQLFSDAGWKLVGHIPGGWLCWRKEAIAGQKPEIFTDRASLKGKYRGLLAMLCISTLPILPLTAFNRSLWRDVAAGGLTGGAAIGLVVAAVACVALGTYGSLRVWRRMQEI